MLRNPCPSVLLYLLLFPILGLVMMYAFLGLLGAMGIDVKGVKKLKCWIYASLLVFVFAVLVRLASL